MAEKSKSVWVHLTPNKEYEVVEALPNQGVRVGAVRLGADMAIRIAKIVVVNTMGAGLRRDNVMESLQTALRIVRASA